MNEIRVGVIGLGFIGQTHIQAYISARDAGFPVAIKGVVDRNTELLQGSLATQGNIDTAHGNSSFDPTSTLTSTDPAILFESEEIDLISICTHTDTHVKLATQALESGKHVLIEKPIASTSVEVQELARVAANAAERGVLCMPAMCMRFWPAWEWLRNAITSGNYGKIRSAAFQRLGTTPDWSDGFYRDKSRSGGALLDLHIHDTDFVFSCFGAPTAVSSTGDEDHISTHYIYDNSAIHITAEGCWDRHPSAPFVMRFTACFENATAEFALGADPELILHDDTGSSPVRCPPTTGWDMQIRAMLTAIQEGSKAPPVSIEDAARVMRIIESEKRSLASGRPEQISS
ncbi:MAG: hypothetical protein Phyf2KO_05150 [Phycisphaerales bacterium]